jgi:hypothetical protein
MGRGPCHSPRAEGTTWQAVTWELLLLRPRRTGEKNDAQGWAQCCLNYRNKRFEHLAPTQTRLRRRRWIGRHIARGASDRRTLLDDGSRQTRGTFNRQRNSPAGLRP